MSRHHLELTQQKRPLGGHSVRDSRLDLTTELLDGTTLLLILAGPGPNGRSTVLHREIRRISAVLVEDLGVHMVAPDLFHANVPVAGVLGDVTRIYFKSKQ